MWNKKKKKEKNSAISKCNAEFKFIEGFFSNKKENIEI